MMISRKVVFMTLILFTMVSVGRLLLNFNNRQHAPHFDNLINTLCSSKSLQIGIGIHRTFRDLSADFETDSAYVANHLSVLEALKRDGYTPVAVSELLPYRASPSESAIPFRVPNVVHYVFLGSDLTFTFSNYLSYRSVERFIKPNQIFVHGDHTPDGKWWNRTIDEVKNIYHVKRTYTGEAPNGQPYKYLAHVSDYMRAETLLSYGGIYLDADVLVVKSFTPLRQFPFVIGREMPIGLCNGIMLAGRGAPFLRLMLEQYRSYLGYNEGWSDKSVLNSDKLARLFPHLVHIEETTLDRPNWLEKEQIYDGRYNWTENYAVHLWIRDWPEEKRPNGVEDILMQDTTFGDIARLAIFGSHEIRKNQQA